MDISILPNTGLLWVFAPEERETVLQELEIRGELESINELTDPYWVNKGPILLEFRA